MFLQPPDVVAKSESLQLPKDRILQDDETTSGNHRQCAQVNNLNAQPIIAVRFQSTHTVSLCSKRPSPIESLPADILSAVFKHCIPVSQVVPMTERSTHDLKEYFTTMPPRNLLRVCRTWRATTLATGTLWAYLHVAMFEPSRMAWKLFDDLLDQFLRLSGAAPLHYSINLSANSEEALEPSCATIAQLLSHQSRWARIEIYGIDIHGEYRVATEALPLDFSSLLMLEEFRTTSARHFGLDALVSSQSRVRLQSLKTLILHTISPSVFTGLMASAANLESFTARIDSRLPKATSGPIPLPMSHSVRKLHLRGDTRAMEQVLGALKAQNLESFSLWLHHATGGLVSFEFVLAFIERSHPPLTFLRVGDCGQCVVETNGQLIQCLRYLPTLTRLEFVPSMSYRDPILDTSFVEELSSSPSSSIFQPHPSQAPSIAQFRLCPRLQILKLGRVFASKEAWVRLFSARWDQNIPFKHRIRRIQMVDCSIPEGFDLAFFDSLGDVARPDGDSVRKNLRIGAGMNYMYWCSMKACDEDPEARLFI